MKNSMKLLVMAALMFAFTMNKVAAQDVVKTNPNNTKLLADTAGVKMILVSLKPGEQLAMHSHPIQQIYCLEAGEVTISHKGGTTDVLKLKAGQAMQAGPEIPHTTKNTGTTPVKIILVEIEK